MLAKQSTPFRAPAQADWVRISKGSSLIHAPSTKRHCPLLTRRHFLSHSQVCRRPKCHLSRTVRPLWRDRLQRAEKKNQEDAESSIAWRTRMESSATHTPHWNTMDVLSTGMSAYWARREDVGQCADPILKGLFLSFHGAASQLALL